MLGTTCDVAELEGAELGNADQSSCVQAVVDFFGPTDFLQMDAHRLNAQAMVHDTPDSPESRARFPAGVRELDRAGKSSTESPERTRMWVLNVWIWATLSSTKVVSTTPKTLLMKSYHRVN